MACTRSSGIARRTAPWARGPCTTRIASSELEELGVELILARSPQAKGRIERLWGTFQDRLTSELRLAGASTAEPAQCGRSEKTSSLSCSVMRTPFR